MQKTISHTLLFTITIISFSCLSTNSFRPSAQVKQLIQNPQYQQNKLKKTSLKSTSKNKVTFFEQWQKNLKEGFGTKAKNVARTMSLGDIVVPLCSNLNQRQELANRGVYPGVEYKITQLEYKSSFKLSTNKNITSMSSLSLEEQYNVVAYIQPSYPLRPSLERNDWPVAIKPLRDVPLWISKSTYEAGTALGTVLFSLNYLFLAAIAAFFIRIVSIPTESMMPFVTPGDVVLVTRSTLIFPPNVGDVVFFNAPPEIDDMISKLKIENAVSSKGKQFVKRVIAVPGEQVGVVNSNPVVDNKRKDIVGEYASQSLFPPECWNRQSQKLKKGEYFVSGDNGARSVDSRVWGPLKQDYVIGTVKWILFPFDHFGPLDKRGFITTDWND